MRRTKQLSRQHPLLMVLGLLSGYGAYFHMSQSDGVSDSLAYQIIGWIEEWLIKHPDFALPGGG